MSEVAHEITRASGIQLTPSRDAVRPVLLGEEARVAAAGLRSHLGVERLDAALAERADLAHGVDVHPVRELGVSQAPRQGRLGADPPRAVDRPGRVELASVADRIGERGHHAEPVY
jgi:hypothetical protein